tara:strand:+ start:90 stop:374 length:285 start_codon:yes stop_codon:yes gene_type:complete
MFENIKLKLESSVNTESTSGIKKKNNKKLKVFFCFNNVMNSLKFKTKIRIFTNRNKKVTTLNLRPSKAENKGYKLVSAPKIDIKNKNFLIICIN